MKLLKLFIHGTEVLQARYQELYEKEEEKIKQAITEAKGNSFLPNDYWHKKQALFEKLRDCELLIATFKQLLDEEEVREKNLREGIDNST